MKIRRLNKREKIILKATLLVCVFLGLINFVIIPTLSRVSSMDREIEDRIMLLKRYSRLKSKGEDILSLYKNYTGSSNKFSFEQAAAGLFVELDKMALKSGLEIKRVKPISTEEQDDYRKVFIELEIEGDFKSIFGFIDNIEKKEFLIKILGLRIYPQQTLGKKLKCSLSLSKMVFDGEIKVD